MSLKVLGEIREILDDHDFIFFDSNLKSAKTVELISITTLKEEIFSITASKLKSNHRSTKFQLIREEIKIDSKI